MEREPNKSEDTYKDPISTERVIFERISDKKVNIVINSYITIGNIHESGGLPQEVKTSKFNIQAFFRLQQNIWDIINRSSSITYEGPI